MIKLLATLVLGLAAASAQAGQSAQQRLDRCLLTGASNASRASLANAITEVRSFCGAQLRQVQAKRVAQARRGLSGAAAEPAERQVIRQFNDEVAANIARLTGLKP